MAAKRKAGPLDTLPPIAGAAATVSIVMYPVDVVRALCMSNPGLSPVAAVKGFLEAHGWAGFVKQGLFAEITRATVSRVAKFFFQPIFHKNCFGRPETQGTPVTKGLAGAFATFPEVFLISPLENIKLAEQLDKEKKFNGMMDVTRHLMRTRGPSGFYIGYFGMQVRQCLWTGGFFLSLDVFKDGVKSAGVSNKLVADTLAGFCAGAFGTSINCWCDVCRSVIQKEAVASTFDASIPRPSPMAAFNPLPFLAKAGEIASTKGIGGLYAGVGPKMVHLGGGGALLAVLMPRFKSAYFEAMGLE
mmetsp:Transcript_46810/g.111367  ORF Transcript_46810/g.111367 Transcript_46810/m.111367 type:complete len:302 (-) Transcript_46810:68-973(-)